MLNVIVFMTYQYCVKPNLMQCFISVNMQPGALQTCAELGGMREAWNINSTIEEGIKWQ